MLFLCVQVKKKWSDLKLATKRRVAALKHSSTQTGGAPAEPSLPLSPTEEKIASIIASGSVGAIGAGGGDAEEVAAKAEEDGNCRAGMSGWLLKGSELGLTRIDQSAPKCADAHT